MHGWPSEVSNVSSHREKIGLNLNAFEVDFGEVSTSCDGMSNLSFGMGLFKSHGIYLSMPCAGFWREKITPKWWQSTWHTSTSSYIRLTAEIHGIPHPTHWQRKMWRFIRDTAEDPKIEQIINFTDIMGLGCTQCISKSFLEESPSQSHCDTYSYTSDLDLTASRMEFVIYTSRCFFWSLGSTDWPSFAIFWSVLARPGGSKSVSLPSNRNKPKVRRLSHPSGFRLGPVFHQLGLLEHSESLKIHGKKTHLKERRKSNLPNLHHLEF